MARHECREAGPLDGPRSKPKLAAVLLTKDPGLEEVRDTPPGMVAFLVILGVEDLIRERARAEGAGEFSPKFESTIPSW